MIDLKKAKDECNKVLAELKADKNRSADWAVNWADLRCVEALYAIGYDSGKYLIFHVEEAAPEDSVFCCEVAKRLRKIYKDRKLQIDVRTEW